jgi:hypothetical protein
LSGIRRLLIKLIFRLEVAPKKFLARRLGLRTSHSGYRIAPRRRQILPYRMLWKWSEKINFFAAPIMPIYRVDEKAF